MSQLIRPQDSTKLPAALSEIGWLADRWYNSDPMTLSDLRGQVVVLHTFQMLCPGCISHSLPLIQEAERTFVGSDVTFIGIHTVFEHHAVMGAEALTVFLHEYRIRHPIAIDRPSTHDPRPQTMAAWNLRGTPSYLIFDRTGTVVLNRFGQLGGVELGAVIGQALATTAENPKPMTSKKTRQEHNPSCDENGCVISYQ